MSALSPALELARVLASLDDGALDRVVADMPPRELEALHYEWPFWARPEQREPEGDWDTWLVLAGRGFGKTRCGGEWIRSKVERGTYGRIALVSATAADGRDTLVEGESGLLAISPRWFRPDYEPSKRRLTWPNGAVATLFSAEEPDRLRGPQFDCFWADELAAWERLEDTWNNLLLGVRLGTNPRGVVTTTPRPLALLRELRADPRTRTTNGSTRDNRANLAPSYLRKLRRFEGTDLGRQELHGEILDDSTGMVFNASWFRRADVEPQLRRVVVGVDPAVSTSRTADETGIIVAGVDFEDRVYVLTDVSGKMSPDAWASAAIKAFDDHAADAIVAETNRGGELVAHTLRTHLVAKGRSANEVKIETVHASRGKATRAEPIAALYQQGRVIHVGREERYAKLERQMVDWDPTRTVSPDRVDALVWAITFLDVAPDARRGFDGLEEVNRALAGDTARVDASDMAPGTHDPGDYPEDEDAQVFRGVTIG